MRFTRIIITLRIVIKLTMGASKIIRHEQELSNRLTILLGCFAIRELTNKFRNNAKPLIKH